MDKSESIFIQFVILTVTLDELQTIADNMRPYTADAMKIEVAPWIKDYVVDMNDFYTDLSLEKIHNKPTGEDCKRLNHYTELFERMQRCNSQLCEPPAKRHRTDQTSNSSPDKCDKILMKGDPGMGKTTQCKKISWDWAMKLFTYFRIVFFVFLKLVKPGDVIENVIMKQNPYMKGLKITEQKLSSILESLGSSCLLILDGLDEHALGTNKDVLSIIKGEKHLKCNIIVTSRPHSTREIEQFFPTVVRVEGFTRKKAKQFASKILKGETLIESVLNYNPGNVDTKKAINCTYEPANPIHKCPILLSFLCLLAREDDIDFLNTKMHTGEIYARMVRCLYKKYVIRKGLCYDSDQFEKAMISIGKLAFKTLLSGDPLLKRDDVIREIGENAFDYGLLIGHEDFRLISNETADIFVTFPHRSIQEFLGALYFIWMLDMGYEIQLILGIDSSKLIFLTDTLFLQFCLWFLREDQKYLTLRNKHKVYQRMVHYCVELFNEEELDMQRIDRTYPALDISSKSVYAKNKLRVSFLGDILMKCNKASSLVLSHRHTLNQFFGFINPNLKSITFIKHGWATHSVSYIKSNEIAIKADTSTLTKLSVIVKHYKKSMNDPIVHLFVRNLISLDYSTNKPPLLNVKTVHLSYTNILPHKLKEACKLITFSPNLTQLFLEDIHSDKITQWVINELCGDIVLNLHHFSLVDCDGMAGELPVLIKSTWPHLQHLNLLETPLSEDDLKFLCLSCNGPKKTLPNLVSLCLTVPEGMSTDAFCAKLFLLSWLELTKLYVDYKFDSDTDGLSNAIIDHKLPNLTCLKIRMVTTTQQTRKPLCLDQLTNFQNLYLDNCIPHDGFQIVLNNLLLSEMSISSYDGLTGNLSSLIGVYFPKLSALTLSNCALTSQDLASIAQANVEGSFPVLKYFDISCNELTLPQFKLLFSENSTWSELLSLDIRWMFKDDEDDQVVDYMNDIVSRGCLPSLQKLGISRFEAKNGYWNHLVKLYLAKCEDDELHNIAGAVSWGYLPVLQTLCVEDFEGHNAEIVSMLSQLGVSCHQTCTFLSIMNFLCVKCLCEK